MDTNVASPEDRNSVVAIEDISIRGEPNHRWRVACNRWKPRRFPGNAYDDSQWDTAFVEGPYPSTAPWDSYTISIPPADQNPGPSLHSAKWIWTNELTAPGSSVPVGARAFRKTINMPDGGLAVQVHVLIATDNEFTLYINGLLVGSGSSYTTANRYLVDFPPTSTVTIAVYAVNTDGPAGVIGAFELITCECSNNVYGFTDESWRFNLRTPAGFIEPGYNDAAWDLAVTEGGFGASPWGPTTAAEANSPQSAALSGAPSAPPAYVVPLETIYTLPQNETDVRVFQSTSTAFFNLGFLPSNPRLKTS
ncbi:hypothetical protein H0H92_014877 [Tricholoma furcatifolium]|nr:hypothetical protein H0H92_014877 [Tricholoma furcatifolium]